MSPELKDVSGFYAGRISSKESEIKKLRAYIGELESAEKRISDEFSAQLRTKNAEIEKLKRALLELQRAGSRLKGSASEWHGKASGSGRELERLRSYIFELENSEKKMAAEYAEQLAGKEMEIKRIVDMLRLKEASNRLLSEKLDGKLRAERDYVERIKNAIARKDSFSREVIEKLTNEVTQKNEEIDRLREDVAKQERLIRRLGSDAVEYRKRQDGLEAFLYEKDSIKNRLEKNFEQQLKNKDYEIERLGSELRKRLDSKPAARSREEIASLKIKLEAKEQEMSELAGSFARLKEQHSILLKRLDERQKLFVESENTYNQLVNSLQLQHEKKVREFIHANSQREVELRTEVEKLKAEQREREMLLSEKESRIDETLLQFSETSKMLLELKGGEGTQGDASNVKGLKQKEEEIEKLLKEAEDRIKEAVRKEQDVAMRETLLVKEQDAINAELSILKNAGVEVQRDKDYLKAKIRQYGAPEKAASLELPALVGEEAVPEVPAEYAGETQPETSQVTEAAPVEEAVEEVSGKSEALEILRRPGKAEVGGEETLQQLPAEPKAEGKKSVKKPSFKQAKSRVKQLPKPPLHSIRAKVERPKIREALIRQAERKEAFPEIGGYGEIHEIESIISIGLQHGDTIEQIRSSLESSGYSRQNIEKAFRQVKKN